MEINEKLIHFTGIGGVSMSALACFAIMNGAYVTGSDKNSIPNKSHLDSLGIKSYIGSDPWVARSADMLVYTSAVDSNDIELVSAMNNGIQVMARHEFLYYLSLSYRDIIAVSGTHGKTTTTSMLAAIFKLADYPFAAHIGGHSMDINSNYYHKGNQLFLTEACEYKRSFLSLKPTLAVILNMDKDHPDTYKSSEELICAFEQFSNNSSITLIHQDIKLNNETNEHIFTYGYDNRANFYYYNINMYSYEKYQFDLYLNGHMLIGQIKLPIPGKHNVANAVAAAASALMWGISPEIIKYALEEFKGVSRRFEVKGKFNGATIISDYAHHPKEIQAVIETGKGMCNGKLIVVYEPHTYSRTKALLQEFKDCFNLADIVIMLPTYAARETKDKGMDTDQLINYINDDRIIKANDYISARQIALDKAQENDIILVLGAGTIEKLAEMMYEKSV